MKKSKFLSVCFGACFGAGQMYLGMYKKGLTIMLGTASLAFLVSLLRLNELLFFLPVIWFLAFFDAVNAIQLLEEERKQKDIEFSDKIMKIVANNNGMSLM